MDETMTKAEKNIQDRRRFESLLPTVAVAEVAPQKPYERFMGFLSTLIAQEFWIGWRFRSARSWLDVGCDISIFWLSIMW